MKDFRFCEKSVKRGLLAECAVAASVALSLIGCAAEPTETGPSVVYVCAETQEAFVGPPQAAPVTHPDTGRKTLVPAIYNPEADRWQPMPPLDLLEGNPGAAVAKDADHPLTLDGPQEGLRRLADG